MKTVYNGNIVQIPINLSKVATHLQLIEIKFVSNQCWEDKNRKQKNSDNAVN